MRQMRLVLMVGGGILLLCVLAVVVSLSDYTSQPAVANAHIPPVVGAPGSGGSSPATASVPTIPVTTIDPTTAPPPQPAPTPTRSRLTMAQQLTFAQILQQLEQRRHHSLPPQR